VGRQDTLRDKIFRNTTSHTAEEKRRRVTSKLGQNLRRWVRRCNGGSKCSRVTITERKGKRETRYPLLYHAAIRGRMPPDFHWQRGKTFVSNSQRCKHFQIKTRIGENLILVFERPGQESGGAPFCSASYLILVTPRFALSPCLLFLILVYIYPVQLLE
jgi:hypothetical protein